MTAAELRQLRQQHGICTRGCGRPATDGDYCDACAETQRDHQRRSQAFLRELRRDNGLCADCGAHSGARYRCDSCAYRHAGNGNGNSNGRASHP